MEDTSLSGRNRPIVLKFRKLGNRACLSLPLILFAQKPPIFLGFKHIAAESNAFKRAVVCKRAK
jgi:hypothetical protein